MSLKRQDYEQVRGPLEQDEEGIGGVGRRRGGEKKFRILHALVRRWSLFPRPR